MSQSLSRRGCRERWRLRPVDRDQLADQPAVAPRARCPRVHGCNRVALALAMSRVLEDDREERAQRATRRSLTSAIVVVNDGGTGALPGSSRAGRELRTENVSRLCTCGAMKIESLPRRVSTCRVSRDLSARVTSTTVASPVIALKPGRAAHGGDPWPPPLELSSPRASGARPRAAASREPEHADAVEAVVRLVRRLPRCAPAFGADAATDAACAYWE